MSGGLSAVTATLCYSYITIQLSAWQSAFAPVIAYVISHQAGTFVNLLATALATDMQGEWHVPPPSFLPIVGFFKPSPKFIPFSNHKGIRQIFDNQIGTITEACFFILLATFTFGWTSIKGWPLAILGMFISILAQPWLAAFKTISSKAS